MSKPKIAIVLSTTRAGRLADKPAKWIYDTASKRDDLTVEIVDLRDYPMPFFDEPASSAWMPSKNEVALRWQKKIAEFDGFVFVTAEYNHGIPAVLKNALDYAYTEWNKKPAAFVGYGSVGGARDRAVAACLCRAADGYDASDRSHPRRRFHGGLAAGQGHQ